MIGNTKKHQVTHETSESKLSPTPIGNDKATTAGLEKTLENRDSTIRQLQAALLKRDHHRGETALDNVQLRNRFGALANSINDWVMTYFKDSLATTDMPSSVAEKVEQVIPQYQKMMQQSRTRYLVVRAVAAHLLFENFDIGCLIGNPDFTRIRKELIQDSENPSFRVKLPC